MQAFILWQKIEPPYIYGILSNFKKVQIGYLDSYGNKVYYASYYDYEDIADDYEPEQEPKSGEQFIGAEWNRKQQRKYYKNLRENLNDSNNPEYTRPQHLADDIQFTPIQQHSSSTTKWVASKISQFQNTVRENVQKITGGVNNQFIDLQEQQEFVYSREPEMSNPTFSVMRIAMNKPSSGYWVYSFGIIKYFENDFLKTLWNNILPVGTSYQSIVGGIVILEENGFYTINGVRKNSRNTPPPWPSRSYKFDTERKTKMEVSINITGKMRAGNNLMGNVVVTFQIENEDGSIYNIASFNAVAGGFGNGAPENGKYALNNYRDRGPNSNWYSKGMTRDGIGFSYNLNPTFKTWRTDLRIHPDGNTEGTLGCIGLVGNKQTLIEFRELLNEYLKTNKSIPVHINIENNPNNNGRNSKVKTNVNE